MVHLLDSRVPMQTKHNSFCSTWLLLYSRSVRLVKKLGFCSFLLRYSLLSALIGLLLSSLINPHFSFFRLFYYVSLCAIGFCIVLGMLCSLPTYSIQYNVLWL